MTKKTQARIRANDQHTGFGLGRAFGDTAIQERLHMKTIEALPCPWGES